MASVAPTTVPAPTISADIDLRYFLEPLNAPADPRSYLDKYPDALYDKALDSHFMRFIYTLLGPVGIGWLQENLVAARLRLEAYGVQMFDLDAFYGNPFAFGRIVTEQFNTDITGLLPDGAWEQIQAQDEAYRSRAIQFLNAARLGTSPQGMQLAASSGIGQNVEIVENYRYLFDSHSDDPLGLPYLGTTKTTGEFIVVPQPAISNTMQQIIRFSEADELLGASTFTLTFNGATASNSAISPFAPLAAGSTAADVQSALSGLATIGPGNVRVTGGPAPADFTVTFTGRLSNQVTLPTIVAQFTLIGPQLPSPTLYPSSGVYPTAPGSPSLILVPVEVVIGAVNPNDETIVISDQNKHDMQVALDYLRPVASYPSYYQARSKHRKHHVASLSGSSNGHCRRRFLTGVPGARWDITDNVHWIMAGVENQARQHRHGCPHHYLHWHEVASIVSYTDRALVDLQYPTSTDIVANYPSVHIGSFPEMRKVMPFFHQFATDYHRIFKAKEALPLVKDHIVVSGHVGSGPTADTAIIDDIYAADLIGLEGTNTAKLSSSGAQTLTAAPKSSGHFWSSVERAQGGDILELDFGEPRAINCIQMEVTDKPLFIEVDYDTLDQSPRRRFVEVVPNANLPYPNTLTYDSRRLNPWRFIRLHFHDGEGMIYTRFIRLVFTRVGVGGPGAFLWDSKTQIQTPWSIDVRNLRVGRKVGPTVA